MIKLKPRNTLISLFIYFYFKGIYLCFFSNHLFWLDKSEVQSKLIYNYNNVFDNTTNAMLAWVYQRSKRVSK